MKRKIFLIGCIFFLSTFSHTVFALEKICDGSTINFSGNTLDEICQGGAIRDTYKGIDSFDGNYVPFTPGYFGTQRTFYPTDTTIPKSFVDIPPGYTGNNRTIELTDETIPKSAFVPVGFLGSLRTFYIPYQEHLVQPVGFYGLYKGVTLNFPEPPPPPQNDIDYAAYPLVKPILGNETVDTGGGGGGAGNTCDAVIAPSNLTYTIKNNGLLDTIEISWDKSDNSKTKLIRIFPEYKVIGGIEGNIYSEIGPVSGTYSYFVTSYSDCQSDVYSDMLKVEYTKQNQPTGDTQLFLDNQTLSLFIPETITPDESTQFSLSCTYLGGEEFIRDFFNKSLIYNIPKDAFEKYFTCYAQFFDENNSLVTSQEFIYIPEVGTTLLHATLLGIIYGKIPETSLDELYKNLVTLEDVLPPDKQSTYGSVALALINVVLGVYIDDTEIAKQLFQDFGLYNQSNTANQIIEYEVFIQVYQYVVAHKGELQTQVLENIGTYFVPTQTEIFEDLLSIYFLNKDLKILKNTDSTRYHQLLECFSLETCTNRTAYQLEKKLIHQKVSQVKKFYSDADDEISYFDFVQMMYQVMGNEAFFDKKYSIGEYEKFVSILREAILYGEDDVELGYFLYHRSILQMIDQQEITSQVMYLTQNYLRKINDIYTSTHRDRLLQVIGDFFE